MGKTIQEMFLTEKLPRTGQTAAVTYDIQNAKAYPIHPENPLLVPAFAASSALRKATNKLFPKTEGVLEEELSGLAPLLLMSEPVLYGTSIVKINTHTTPAVVSMKLSANGITTPGILSGVVSALASVTNKVATKLGTKEYSPTDLMNDAKFNNVAGNTVATVDYLNTLRGGPGALGNILGGALKGGTAGQMGSAVIVGAVSTGANALRKALFGSTNGGVNTDHIQVSYSSTNPYTSYMMAREDDYMLFSLEGKLYREAALPPKTDISKGSAEFTFNEFGKLQGYSTIPSIALLNIEKGANKMLMYKYSNKAAKPDSVKYDKAADYNAKLSRVFKENVDSIDTSDDFVTLAFKSTSNSIRFPATLTGLSENVTPSWDSAKFIGSPFNYYTYTGIERSVSINFKVYSNNVAEHEVMWKRIKALTYMTYPQGYVGYNLAVVAPFISVTIGNLYKNKPSFIESLSYTQLDEAGWEIGKLPESLGGSAVSKNWVLPRVIEVSMTLKFLESAGNTKIDSGYANRELYSFGKLTGPTATKEPELPGAKTTAAVESTKPTFGTNGASASESKTDDFSGINQTPLKMPKPQ